MSCRIARGAGLLACATLLCSCGSSKRSGVSVIAVAPLENLSGQAALDWIASSVPRGLEYSFSRSPSLRILPAARAGDVHPPSASFALTGYYSVESGQLRFSLVLRDLMTQKNVRALEARGPVEQGVPPLLQQLARAIDDSAGPTGTASAVALQRCEEALRAEHLEQGREAFQAAVAADPNFGACYVHWANRLLAAGDSQGAVEAAGSARQKGTALAEWDHHRLLLIQAQARRDRPAAQSALIHLAKLAPGDSALAARVAEGELSLRRFPSAVTWYRQATQADPGNIALWNQLGYAQACARDLGGAVASLRRYQALAPQDPNPLDSLGEVHFYLGRFAEAETYFAQCFEKAPAFQNGAAQAKAAMARWMAGDVTGADALFQKYVEARRTVEGQVAEYRLAVWEYLTGNTARARERMQRLSESPPAAPEAPTGWSAEEAPDPSPRSAVDVAPLARAQLALWAVFEGKPDSARLLLEKFNPGTSASARAVAFLTLFLAQPPASAQEWAARAARAFAAPAQEPLRASALATALLLGRHFAEAATELRPLHAASRPPQDGLAQVLLAWALVQAGREAEAKGLIDVFPIPQPPGDLLFQPLLLPRLWLLRGLVLAKAGDKEGSRQALQRYTKLRGDASDPFEEVKTARSLLAQ